jgi:3-dehydroquinate dehydratase / shikimate dehydrogenase
VFLDHVFSTERLMPKPVIVQTVTGTSMAELCARRDAAVHGDLIELRLDGVVDVDPMGAVTGSPRPTIVTCRPVWEGGRWDGDEAGRRRVMAGAVQAGADYVDIERRAGWVPDLRGTRTRLIVSDHDFIAVPSDLGARIREMRAHGADVVKVAAAVALLSDALRFRDGVASSGDEGPLVCIAMGEAGTLSRLLPGRFHSCWTYGGDAGAAPGQIPVEVMRDRYRVHHVTASTLIFGVAGSPIAHSASPAMHNAACIAAGIDAIYVPVLARTAAEAAMAAEALGFAGLSVTAPLKGGWLDRKDVDNDDDVSRRLGVVNTLKRVGDRWSARNLDIAGFLDSLDARGLTLAGTSALVLGAGGAARAATWALAHRGAIVTLSARRGDAAEVVAADLGVRTVPWPPAGAWDVVVNATSAGTWPHTSETPIEAASLQARVAYDLVYNPEDTTFLRQMQEAGAEVIGGLDMLVGQAARQFEWWTGHRPDTRVMREAARRWIREKR